MTRRLTIMLWFGREGKFKLAYARASTGDRYIKLGRLLIGWWWNYYLDGKEVNCDVVL